MQNHQRFQLTLLANRTFKLLSIAILLFAITPDYAHAYGGHHGYGHGYSHHSYGHHHGHHGVHYGAHVSGDAGYVILGILGVAVLSHIISNNNNRQKTYHKNYSYNHPRHYTPPRSTHAGINNAPKAKNIYVYQDNEGWDWLAKGNAKYALDIFAIQSQQNLNSGVPKIGFAIAAAANGDIDRATRAMRKAVRIEATALDKIDIRNIKSTIESVSQKYQSASEVNNSTDTAFMMATLSYLQQDYSTANDMISEENDQSQSANNLRKLIVEKEG